MGIQLQIRNYKNKNNNNSGNKKIKRRVYGVEGKLENVTKTKKNVQRQLISETVTCNEKELQV